MPTILLKPHSSQTPLAAVDDELSALIRDRTAEDPTYWSSPDRERRDAVHALFQYPAMMVPIVQRRLIEVVKAVQRGVVSMYDPFVGAGTALVAGMYHGLDCYGLDINPLALLVTRVKTGPLFLECFREAAESVINAAIAEAAYPQPNRYLEKWFTPEVAARLSSLQSAIRAVENRYARRFLWVTLAETTRLTSNDRTSTYKLHMRPEADIVLGRPDPLVVFQALIHQNLADLLEHCDLLKSAHRVRNGKYCGIVRTALGDSTIGAMKPIGGGRFDLVVTSPPYGDNTTTVTYGQHSYLPLQWTDFSDIDVRADPSMLRTTQEIDRQSLGGIFPKLKDERVSRVIARSPAFAQTLEALTEKREDHARRVAAYVVDLDDCLFRIASSVRRNGYLIWTIGNRCVGGIEIPNDSIIVELFQAHGVIQVTSVGRTIHSKRMAPRNGFADTMKSEEIVVFRQARKTAND